MGIEMLRRRPPSPEDLTQRLDMIEQQWRKLNDINEKILQLRTIKFDHNSLYFQTIDLVTFIKNFLVRYQDGNDDSEAKGRVLKTQWPNAPILFNIDVNCLEKILKELLTNAEKFALPQTPIQLNIQESQEMGSDKITISCRNLAPQTSPNNLKYFFDPFYREQWTIDTAIPGIGLGLTITKTLLEYLNGTIEVICEPTDNPDCCSIIFVLTFSKNSLTE
jgi:K+-sensing histidine kinase KdpD